MKSHETHDGLGATDSAPQPGDFPLGSVESRAAARGKLMRMQEMTPLRQRLPCDPGYGTTALLILPAFAGHP